MTLKEKLEPYLKEIEKEKNEVCRYIPICNYFKHWNFNNICEGCKKVDDHYSCSWYQLYRSRKK